MDRLWLPEGHHWDLHIEHDVSEDAGSFTGGGWKLCWHTTESPWLAVDAMVNTVQAKRACPHFVIGRRAGLEHPVVVQLIPLNHAGRALQNFTADGYQTNRANTIQVEICGATVPNQNIPQADWVTNWSDARYKALANLAGLIMHRVDIPNVGNHDFSNPVRMGDSEWVQARGHVGHCHAPDNDHVDPSRMREGFLVNLIRDLPEAGYPL
jgi:hypothetical protein